MGRAYIIEHHHMRDRIIADLMAGRSNRWIAEYTDPPIHESTIANYKLFRLKPLIAQIAAEATVAVPNQERNRHTNKHIAEGPVPIPSIADAVGHKPITVREDRLRGGTKPIDPEALAIVKQAVTTSTTERPAQSIFRQRLESLHTRVERVMDRAEEQDAIALMAPLIGQAHKNAELLGRATGELEMGGNTNSLTIQILSPSAPSPALAPRISYASVDAIDQVYDEEEIGIVQRPQQ